MADKKDTRTAADQNANPGEDTCGKACACHTHQINRRDFISLGSLTVFGATLLGTIPVMADTPSFMPVKEAPDFAALIPPDKHLRPEWVKSLFARGAPTVYIKKRDELRYIGMPVGGLCCGTVYLGRRRAALELEHLQPKGTKGALVGEVDAPKRRALCQAQLQMSPFEQGFALRVGGKVYPFAHDGWEEIAFRGEYPVGDRHLRRPRLPGDRDPERLLPVRPPQRRRLRPARRDLRVHGPQPRREGPGGGDRRLAAECGPRLFRRERGRHAPQRRARRPRRDAHRVFLR